MDIPKDLEGCFAALGKIFKKQQLKKFKTRAEDELGAYHFGIGIWMRNNWGLWAGSKLAKYFNDMGIFNADDMSEIILISFHRHLNGEEIRLDEQVKFYQECWKGGPGPSHADVQHLRYMEQLLSRDEDSPKRKKKRRNIFEELKQCFHIRRHE